ncbi:MAG: hypothetical protein K9W43_09910 [Candidatus Thorarchaeota archaeon]|nr:hypothetical protein [Candidatus Thorarchaeota archaeon]
MAHTPDIWRRDVEINGKKYTVTKEGNQIVIKNKESGSQDASSTRRYKIHQGVCPRCQGTQGSLDIDRGCCSTCCEWQALERVIAMGTYYTWSEISVQQRIQGRALDLSQDLISAKSNMEIAEKIGAALGIFVLSTASEIMQMSNIVTVVPIDTSRKKYNPVEVIAEKCCEITGLPKPRKDLLQRIQENDDKEMHKLGRGARRISAEKQFIAGPGVLPADSSVLIIDDILTTGNTLEYCARRLRDKGAVSVGGLVVGRTN